MRLRSEADVQEFLDAVSQCGGDVYFCFERLIWSIKT